MEIQDQINNDVFALLSGQYGFIIKDTMRLVGSNMKQDLQTFDAVLWFHHAELTHSENNFLEAIKGLEKTLQNDPNNVMCLLILGEVYLCCYSYGYAVEDPINKASQFIEKAIRIAPFSQYAHIQRGWENIHLGKKKEAIESLKYSEQLAPSSFSPSSMGTLGFAFACVGEYKRSRNLLQTALNLNPYCPYWYYMGLFFGYYQNGHYEEAFKYAQKMKASDDVYLIPLLMCAVKGQLNMRADAEANADADKAAKETAEKINAADSMIFQTEKQLKEFGEKLSADKKDPIEAALVDLKKAHEAKDLAQIDAAMEKINEAWKVASEEMYKAEQAGQAEGAPAGDAQPNAGSDNVEDVDFEEVKEEK
jgi:hypothetical protein